MDRTPPRAISPEPPEPLAKYPAALLDQAEEIIQHTNLHDIPAMWYIALIQYCNDRPGRDLEEKYTSEQIEDVNVAAMKITRALWRDYCPNVEEPPDDNVTMKGKHMRASVRAKRKTATKTLTEMADSNCGFRLAFNLPSTDVKLIKFYSDDSDDSVPQDKITPQNSTPSTPAFEILPSSTPSTPSIFYSQDEDDIAIRVAAEAAADAAEFDLENIPRFNGNNSRQRDDIEDLTDDDDPDDEVSRMLGLNKENARPISKGRGILQLLRLSESLEE